MRIFLIGSGKGGVGKSTISVNLAVALAKSGLKVGLLDADLFGPSIPMMMGLRRLSPRHSDDQKILPFHKFGIHVMSIGFFMEEAEAGLWRGPVLHTLLDKLLNDVLWGDLDILLIDLPPGTGDVPISLSQLTQVEGAIIVTTPQEVAVADARKAIHAFDILNIPVLGLVENMAGFAPGHGDTTFPLFGYSRGPLLADRFQISFLGSIPFLPDIMSMSDQGVPSAWNLEAKVAFQAFEALKCQFSEKILHNPLVQKN